VILKQLDGYERGIAALSSQAKLARARKPDY
jgi:hypothetical protein